MFNFGEFTLSDLKKDGWNPCTKTNHRVCFIELALRLSGETLRKSTCSAAQPTSNIQGHFMNGLCVTAGSPDPHSSGEDLA